MNFAITLGLYIIIVILIAYSLVFLARKWPKIRAKIIYAASAIKNKFGRARKMHPIVAALKDTRAQRVFLEAGDENATDSDTLFARAQAFMQLYEDTGKSEYNAKAKETIRRAITARNDETCAADNNQREQEDMDYVFTDDMIARRALEMQAIDDQQYLNLPIAAPAPARGPLRANNTRTTGAVASIVAKPLTIAVGQWNSDPENVHDSSVNKDVEKRYEWLLEHDQHLYGNTPGAGSREIIGILYSMVDGSTMSADKKARAHRTLHQASTDAFYDRFRLSECDALRLVFERGLAPENTANGVEIINSLLDMLADCSPEPYYTVCLTGRMTRYAGALDIIDERVNQVGAVVPVDAWRAEIFQRLGRMVASLDQSNSTDPGDPTNHITVREWVARLIEEYRDKVSATNLARISAECYQGVEGMESMSVPAGI